MDANGARTPQPPQPAVACNAKAGRLACPERSRRVAEGPPEKVAKARRSHTAKLLARILKNGSNSHARR